MSENLAKMAVLDPASGYSISHVVDDPQHIRVLAAHGGKIVGALHLDRIDPDSPHISAFSVEVDPEHRRKGVASALYAHAEKVTGKKMKPSSTQSPGGRALWDGNEAAPQFGKSEPAPSIPKKRKKNEKLVASVAAFNEEGELLFGLRSDAQKWTLPGGHLEEDEEPLKGAVRELREEAGLKPLSMTYLGHGVVRRDSGDIRVYCFKATVTGTPTGEDDPDQECQTWRFVSVKDGLPADIADHLFSKNNITLRLLGLQEGEIRKFESPLAKNEDDSERARLDRLHNHFVAYQRRSAPPGWQGHKSEGRDVDWSVLPYDLRTRYWDSYLNELGRQVAEKDYDAIPPTTDSYTRSFWNKPEAGVVDPVTKHLEWGRHLFVLPDYDNPPPFVDKRYAEFIAAHWPGFDERTKQELWDREFRSEQTLVRKYGLEKYLTPTETYRKNAHDPEGNWATKSPWGRWEHLEEQEHLDSRRPDEDDVEFMLRHPVTGQQLLALNLPGVEPRHLDLALDKFDRGEGIAGLLGKIVEHPQVESRHLSRILANPHAHIINRTKALKHPKMDSEGLDLLVDKLYELGDTSKEEENGQLADVRLMHVFLEHPALSPLQMKRLLLPHPNTLHPPIGLVGADHLLSREDLDKNLLSDLVLNLDGMNSVDRTTRVTVASYALRHQNLPPEAIDAFLEAGTQRHRAAPHGVDLQQRNLEQILAKRPDLRAHHVATLFDWQKRHGALPGSHAEDQSAPMRAELLHNLRLNFTPEQLKSAAIDGEYMVRKALLSRRDGDVTPEHLRLMLDYRDSWDDIAGHHLVTPEILDTMLGVCEREPKTTSHLLAKVVKSPKLSGESLARVASNPNMYQAWINVAEHPSVTANHMAQMVQTASRMEQEGHTVTGYAERQLEYALQLSPDRMGHTWVADPGLRKALRANGAFDSLDDRLRAKFYLPHTPVQPEELNDIILNKSPYGWEATQEAAAKHDLLPVETAKAILLNADNHDKVSQGARASLMDHEDLTAEDLHNVFTTFDRAGEPFPEFGLNRMFHHRNADDALRGRVLAVDPETTTDLLMHAPADHVAPHLEALTQHQHENVRAQAIAHSRTPAGLVHKAALNDPSPRVRRFAIQSNKLTLDTIKQMAENDPDVTIRNMAQSSLAVHDPDSAFSHKVLVKLGTGKVRKVRDAIRSLGKDREHPKNLPPGDWSMGRGPDGNIHVARLQAWIDKLEGQQFNLSHDIWEDAQRHSNEHSKVFQVNLTTGHIEKMKEAGVYDTFRAMQEASAYSSHPVHPQHGIGWVRYTQASDPVGECQDCDGNGTVNVDSEYGCPDCDESGVVQEPDKQECSGCSGSGIDTEPDEDGNEQQCAICNGTGEEDTEIEVNCERCDGSGSITENEEVTCDTCGGQGKLTGHDEGVKPTRSAYGSSCDDCGKSLSDPAHANPKCQCDAPEFTHQQDHEFVPGQRLTEAGTPVRGSENYCATCEAHQSTHHKFEPKPAPGAHRYVESNHPDEFFIDEVQSDFGQSFVRQAAAQAREEGMDEEEAARRAEEKYPEQHFKIISKILFNGKHPNEILHEAFQQHLRDLGHHNSRVSVHTVETKAPISLGRSLGYLCETCKKPEEHHTGCGHCGEHEGNHSPHLHGFDPDPANPEECGGMLGGVPCGYGRDDLDVHLDKLDLKNPKKHLFKRTDHKYVKGKEVNRLAAPGHFNVTYHDIPKKLGMEQGTYGSMATHKPDDGEVKAGAPVWEGKVRKFETEAAIWLATQPLVKMAVKPSDMKPVGKYHSDEGANFVDHERERDQHPGEHAAHVAAFKAHVLDSPDIVKRGKTGTRTASNSTGKVVYDVKEPWPGAYPETQRFMVKPYHEKTIPRIKKWCPFPIQGWAEMTNQSLYHAAGIGDLHQKVHVAEIPMPVKWSGTKTWQEHMGAPLAPALVVHMQDRVAGGRALHALGGRLDAETRQQVKKIGLMDFLSNNLDRHHDNLLWDNDRQRFLAIDHSRSFQYANIDKHTDPKHVANDWLGKYLGHDYDQSYVGAALGTVDPRPQRRYGSGAGFDAGAADREYWQKLDAYNEEWNPVFDWWEKSAPHILDTMHKRLDLIKDTNIREHVRRNFERRVRHLNEYVRDGHENYGHDNWQDADCPLFRFGTRDHEED